MKILLTVDPEIPVPPILYGGIERIVDSLVRGYVERDHDVTLVAHSDSIVPCQLVSWTSKHSGGIRNIVTHTGQLLSQVLKNRYDVVHSFSRLAYITPLLPLTIPKVMSYQREPTISQIKKAAWLTRGNSLIFTGCSNYIANQIKQFATAETVYNFVPIEKYDFKASVSEDAPLTFLGRIEPIKGTHIAVEVAQKTNRRLVIAGNIPKEGEQYFKEQIQPYLNDRIQYVGPVNDQQKNEILGQSAAFLMPIQWNEPFGIVMAEAMACGTPVLGFPFGSVPEVVEDGITGYVCQNVEEMISRIYTIENINRKCVREAAEKRFSHKKIVDDYLALYNIHIKNNHLLKFSL